MPCGDTAHPVAPPTLALHDERCCSGLAGRLISLAPPAAGLRNPAPWKFFPGTSFSQAQLPTVPCPDPIYQPHALAFAKRLLTAHTYLGAWHPRMDVEKSWVLGEL